MDVSPRDSNGERSALARPQPLFAYLSGYAARNLSRDCCRADLQCVGAPGSSQGMTSPVALTTWHCIQWTSCKLGLAAAKSPSSMAQTVTALAAFRNGRAR